MEKSQLQIYKESYSKYTKPKPIPYKEVHFLSYSNSYVNTIRLKLVPDYIYIDIIRFGLRKGIFNEEILSGSLEITECPRLFPDYTKSLHYQHFGVK